MESPGEMAGVFLHHFDIDTDARGQIYIRQCFNNLGCRIKYIDHSLMYPHFELLAGVFIDKSGTIYCVFFYVYRKWNWADDFRVVAGCGINNLFDRRI